MHQTIVSYCATAVHKSRPNWTGWLKLCVKLDLSKKSAELFASGKSKNCSEHRESRGGLELVGGNSPDLQSRVSLHSAAALSLTMCFGRFLRKMTNRDGEAIIVQDATALHSSSTSTYPYGRLTGAGGQPLLHLIPCSHSGVCGSVKRAKRLPTSMTPIPKLTMTLRRGSAAQLSSPGNTVPHCHPRITNQPQNPQSAVHIPHTGRYRAGGPKLQNITPPPTNAQAEFATLEQDLASLRQWPTKQPIP